MLKIAVPNKGTLADAALTMLREAGYLPKPVGRSLVVSDVANDAEFYLLRPRDIATYVGAGRLDVGITGRDLLLDSGAPATELVALGFGDSTFRFAAPTGTVKSISDLNGLRIATSYKGIVAKALADAGVSADVVGLDGAVENAVALGVADAVADVVDTGTTLRAAGLELVGEPILQSEAILIGRSEVGSNVEVQQLLRRLEGVIVARTYVMMEYDVSAELVEKACELTPGIESPTVSPLRDEGWMAVRAMVPRADQHLVMDSLWNLGARGVIVTDIHACRL
ncbi:MAG: ATP phosphoribosyltransferase [Actinomycetes bacterium]|jgi:ATP phosphoribosyltransferase